MGPICQIFRNSRVDPSLICDLPARIEQCFHQIGLQVSTDVHVLEPLASAFDTNRNQYKADKIVEHCCREAPGRICLYLLSEDAYSGTLNFVFGVAHRSQGCMISLFRLDDDADFIYKECVHELGHVFGLGHCYPPCVMTFSNSVAEAHEKQMNFCASCESKLMHHSHH